MSPKHIHPILVERFTDLPDCCPLSEIADDHKHDPEDDKAEDDIRELVQTFRHDLFDPPPSRFRALSDISNRTPSSMGCVANEFLCRGRLLGRRRDVLQLNYLWKVISSRVRCWCKSGRLKAGANSPCNSNRERAFFCGDVVAPSNHRHRPVVQSQTKTFPGEDAINLMDLLQSTAPSISYRRKDVERSC